VDPNKNAQSKEVVSDCGGNNQKSEIYGQQQEVDDLNDDQTTEIY
jgi:hypothetical protein